MNKTIFTNRIFFYLLIVYLLLLFFYNLGLTITNKYLLGIIPLTIQGVLLFFIFTKNKFVKLLILIWAIIFQLISSGLQVIGGLILGFEGNFESFNWSLFTYNLVEIAVGILIVDFTRRTVIVSRHAQP